MEKDPFYDSAKKLLGLIPGLKIVELKSKCGHNSFDKINGESKEFALKLMNEAANKGAKLVICTSPNCESHLLMCHREGSWRSVDIEISDVYRLLYSSLTGEF
jgi:Fe-S oxidoreductase